MVAPTGLRYIPICQVYMSSQQYGCSNWHITCNSLSSLVTSQAQHLHPALFQEYCLTLTEQWKHSMHFKQGQSTKSCANQARINISRQKHQLHWLPFKDSCYGSQLYSIFIEMPYTDHGWEDSWNEQGVYMIHHTPATWEVLFMSVYSGQHGPSFTISTQLHQAAHYHLSLPTFVIRARENTARPVLVDL